MFLLKQQKKEKKFRHTDIKRQSGDVTLEKRCHGLLSGYLWFVKSPTDNLKHYCEYKILLLTSRKSAVCSPQTKDILEMAIHRVVCRKFNFHGNSDFQNYQKLDPLQIPAKKFQAKIC
jgi:hypothetical protein